MSSFLPLVPDQFKKIPGARVAIISSQWHSLILEKMVLRAQEELIKARVEPQDISVHYLPGSMELPYAADLLFTHDSQLDAILAFGIVLQGITTHDQSVIQAVTHGFTLVTQRHQKPIINEVIGVSSLEDARSRAQENHNNKGLEAVFALTELLSWQRNLLLSKPGK